MYGRTEDGSDLLLHLAAEPVGRRGRINLHIGPGDALVLRDRSNETKLVGQAKRKISALDRDFCGCELAKDRIAALSIEDLADLQIALRGGGDIGVEGRRDPRGLAAYHDRGDRDVQLKPDHVPLLVGA